MKSDAALCNLIESIPCGILRLIAYEPVVEEVVRPWLGLLSLECNLTESMDRSSMRVDEIDKFVEVVVGLR